MPNTDGGWVLPEVIDPPRVCFQIEIPNDFHHRAAFFGALYELTRWYNWQRDDDHTGKAVAAIWMDIWRAANNKFYSAQGSCEMQTKIRMDTACGVLQVSYDDGATWENIVDIGSCIASGVQTAVDDGVVSAPGQQGAGGTVPSQECKTYKITLHGNSRWHCPVPVSAGYTITVSNATGATGDNGAITALWACPDGRSYALGVCGAYRDTQPTDPLQSAAHLRLIGYCQGIYMDMYNTSYEIPVGTPESAFFLQVNDGNISDNQGELSLTVTVCNYSEWCYTSDFTTGLHGWIVDIGTQQNGQGILAASSGYPNQQGTYVHYNVPDGVTLTSIDMLYDRPTADPVPNGPKLRGYDAIDMGGNQVLSVANDDTGTNLHITWSGSQSIKSVLCSAMGLLGSSQRIISIKLTGIVPNPFGESNC